MSTSVSFTGLSVRIKEDRVGIKSLQEIAIQLGSYDEKELANFDDDFYEDYLYDSRKNCWRIYQDSEGVIGIIYLIDNERNIFDMDYKLSLGKINELMGSLLNELPKNYLTMDADSVNIFAYLYYNGGDNPFTF